MIDALYMVIDKIKDNPAIQGEINEALLKSGLPKNMTENIASDRMAESSFHTDTEGKTW